MTVYGCCVLLVNAVLLKMTNNYTGYGELMILLQCGAFWLTVYIETKYPIFVNMYHLWYEFIGSASAWLGFIISVLSIFSLDIAARTLLRIIICKVSGQPMNYDKVLMFENGQADV